MRYGAVLQCSLWGWRSWSYHGVVRRTPPRNSHSSPKNHWYRLTRRRKSPPATRLSRWTRRMRPLIASTPPLDRALLDGLADPGDHLVEHLVQRRRRLEAEHVPRLLDRRDAALHVVLERV